MRKLTKYHRVSYITGTNCGSSLINSKSKDEALAHNIYIFDPFQQIEIDLYKERKINE